MPACTDYARRHFPITNKLDARCRGHRDTSRGVRTNPFSRRHAHTAPRSPNRGRSTDGRTPMAGNSADNNERAGTIAIGLAIAITALLTHLESLAC